jgi:hypothetical protein
MVGKNGADFPMIGKIFRAFSNDWKKIRVKRAGEEKTNRSKREQNGRVECGRDGGIENHENRFADMEKREGCGWGRQLGQRGTTLARCAA